MAASVTVDYQAFADRRIAYLGELAGYSHMEALGRMVTLWSRCTELQTDRPGAIEIEACIGRDEALFVKSGLGEPTDNGVRIRGCTGRTEWFAEVLDRNRKGGEARAATAGRGPGGRFTRSSETSLQPACSQPAPASDPIPDQDQDLTRPDLPCRELPDPGAIVRAERGSSAEREIVRRRLVTMAWQYAGERYREVGRDGIDPSAVPNCWNGLPSASSDEMRELKARIDELLDGKAPTYEAAEALIKRRIDVAAAEARRDRRRDYMTPPRMWNAKSFSIASSMSPEQASRPRTGPARAEDRGMTRFKLPEAKP